MGSGGLVKESDVPSLNPSLPQSYTSIPHHYRITTPLPGGVGQDHVWYYLLSEHAELCTVYRWRFCSHVSRSKQSLLVWTSLKGRAIHGLSIYDINFGSTSFRFCASELTAQGVHRLCPTPRERRDEARTRYFWVFYEGLLREQVINYLLITSTLLSFSMSQGKTPVTLIY